jgi:hypothetical protein
MCKNIQLVKYKKWHTTVSLPYALTLIHKIFEIHLLSQTLCITTNFNLCEWMKKNSKEKLFWQDDEMKTRGSGWKQSVIISSLQKLNLGSTAGTSISCSLKVYVKVINTSTTCPHIRLMEDLWNCISKQFPSTLNSIKFINSPQQIQHP